ncbi:thioredoxin family protein [bacterium]|nr:thioredoxin family protein [bacterium]
MQTSFRLMLFLLITILFIQSEIKGQQPQTVKLSVNISSVDAASFTMDVRAVIDPQYHIYGVELLDGPVPTTVVTHLPANIRRSGDLISPKGTKHFDEGFGIDVTWHSGTVVFKQPLEITGPLNTGDMIGVEFRYQACTESYCLPPKTVKATYSIPLSVISASQKISQSGMAISKSEAQGSKIIGNDQSVIKDTVLSFVKGNLAIESSDKTVMERTASYESLRGESLVSFIGLAFLTGFLALLTPCVFPMIPITVSYFTKHSAKSRFQAIKQSVVYILGIIVSFALFGWLMSLILGASGAQNFAANVWVNMIIGILFIVFALSLFGVFEIRLPSFIVNFSQQHSDTGRTIGTLFAGVTFTLVSFTCTVQFLGLLMVASANGEWFLPVIGMLCFATAFSAPFFFLSLFPQYLANMPKSGSWLHATKIIMAFIEVAAAFKFFSNVDLVWDTQILTRPVLLSIWIVLFGISGFYLLGKIKFSEDDTVESVGAGRTGLGIFFLSLTTYLLSGLFGHPLQADLDSYLPPADYGAIHSVRSSAEKEENEWIENYPAALARARETGKPLFIDFTGKTCTNCRLMEKTIFVREDVDELFGQMVLSRLWTDFGESQEMNQELQQKLVGSVALPFYVIIDPEENVLATFGGLERNPEIFKMFLNDGLEKMKITADIRKN